MWDIKRLKKRMNLRSKFTAIKFFHIITSIKISWWNISRSVLRFLGAADSLKNFYKSLRMLRINEKGLILKNYFFFQELMNFLNLNAIWSEPILEPLLPILSNQDFELNYLWSSSLKVPFLHVHHSRLMVLCQL